MERKWTIWKENKNEVAQEDLKAKEVELKERKLSEDIESTIKKWKGETYNK